MYTASVLGPHNDKMWGSDWSLIKPGERSFCRSPSYLWIHKSLTYWLKVIGLWKWFWAIIHQWKLWVEDGQHFQLNVVYSLRGKRKKKTKRINADLTYRSLPTFLYTQISHQMIFNFLTLYWWPMVIIHRKWNHRLNLHSDGKAAFASPVGNFDRSFCNLEKSDALVKYKKGVQLIQS